jgi:hypothetical protein
MAIPGEEGSKALERFILENKGDADREWEANRALRLLIERHGASQELGPFRWVLREEPALALRSIEAAAQTPSPQGLAFLLAVRESFPQGHPVRLRADAAIARRQAKEAK